MGLLDDFEPERRRYTCRVRTVLEELDESDQKILEDALADKDKWTNNSLAKELKKRGIDLKSESMRKHRDGLCQCSKI